MKTTLSVSTMKKTMKTTKMALFVSELSLSPSSFFAKTNKNMQTNQIHDVLIFHDVLI
jgi:hypothetical protein